MTQTTRTPGRPKDVALAARRRAEILQAAAEIFAEQGYRQTDVQVVADRLGVGKGTIYRYFPSKEDLFLAAVDAGMRELSARVHDAVLGEADPMVHMDRGVKAYLKFFDEHPGMVELLIIERAEFRGRNEPTYFAHQRSNEGKWRRFLEDSMQAGYIRSMPARQILEVVSNVLYGAIFTNHFAGRSKPFEQQANDIVDVVFYGIFTEAERKRRMNSKPARRTARPGKAGQ